VLSRGKRLLGGGLILLLTGMAAALIGLGKLPAAAGWTAVGLAAAAGLSGVLLTPLAERLRLRIATAHGRTTAVQGLLRTGALQELLVHEADPIRLGVHPAWKLPGAAPVPPYVPRTIDAELDRKLASGGLVVVQGDSAAGKAGRPTRPCDATRRGLAGGHWWCLMTRRRFAHWPREDPGWPGPWCGWTTWSATCPPMG
jgi:hypothetical protein